MLSKFTDLINSAFGASKAKQQEQLLEAVEFHQQGKLAEARAAYEDILSANPKHDVALNLLGVVMAQQGRFQEAVDLIAKAIAINPKDASYYINRGNALKEMKQWIMALASYDKAINIQPDLAAAYYSRAIVNKALNKLDVALADYDQTIRIQSDYAQAHYGRGIILQELNQLEDALMSYQNAIKAYAEYAEAWFACGVIHQMKGHRDDALAAYKKAITVNPAFAEAHYNLGDLQQSLEQYEDAIDSYDKVIRSSNSLPQAYARRGDALHKLHQLNAALASYDKAILAAPGHFEAYFNRANVLKELGKIDEAIKAYDDAIYVQPDFYQAHYNRANTLKVQGNLQGALDGYVQAIAFKPDFTEAYFNRGAVLQDLQRLDEALQSYEQALRLSPNNSDAYNNIGTVLLALKNYDAAVAKFLKALELKSDNVEAHANLGNAFKYLGQYEEAFASFEKASVLNQEYSSLMLMHTRMWLCDWDNFDVKVAGLAKDVELHAKSAQPINYHSLIDNSAVHRVAAETWSADQYPFNPSLGEITKHERAEKIRIGYFSSDFRQHPVSILLAELFEAHDRSRFELFAFSTGAETYDPLRQRIKTAFDHFIDVTYSTDKEVAQLARQHGIDIAIDLGRHTQDSRVAVFSYRAAPIQLSYVGYLGTMGAEYYDYLLADPILIPEASRGHYSEKIAYLPSYQANDSKRQIAERVFPRQELGLPEQGFVFCCFNNNYKITPSTFDRWMRVLKAVTGSVLMLYVGNATARDNLRKEAQQRGVEPERIIFADRLPYEEHLARYRAMDLFLDTLPYNAGATASDALWAGLPVLTLLGESFASRYAASLLSAIELPELIAETDAQFEALAIELATHSEKLQALKDKLKQNRQTTPLFDTPKFTRHLEAAYTAMHERYQADLPPDHLKIDD